MAIIDRHILKISKRTYLNNIAEGEDSHANKLLGVQIVASLYHIITCFMHIFILQNQLGDNDVITCISAIYILAKATMLFVMICNIFMNLIDFWAAAADRKPIVISIFTSLVYLTIFYSVINHFAEEGTVLKVITLNLITNIWFFNIWINLILKTRSYVHI